MENDKERIKRLEDEFYKELFSSKIDDDLPHQMIGNVAQHMLNCHNDVVQDIVAVDLENVEESRQCNTKLEN